MIVDKDWTITTTKNKGTLCVRISLDKELLRIVQVHLLSEIREAAAPEDLTDYDEMLDRVKYINDLADSLNIVQDAINAIHEIDIQESIEKDPLRRN